MVLEVSKAVDSQLTSEEEEILTSTILSAYNVSSSEVEIELDYTTSGSITIADIPADFSVEEIEEAVIESLSESLGVHPKDIEIISIDPESGKIEFEIKGDSFEEAKAIQELISNVDGESKFSDDLKSSLSEVLPGSSVTAISSDPIIEVEANIVIDASDAKSNLKDANEKITQELEEVLGFAVEDISVDLLTAGPTISPTQLTSIPTARPSMTGIIVTLEFKQLKGKGGDLLTTSELLDLESEIAKNYGVSIDEVQVDVDYEITGSMKIDIPEEGLNKDEIALLEETLQTQLGEELNIHPERIEVSVDPESGEVTYIIRTDEMSDAEEIQSLIETKSDEIFTNINEELEIVFEKEDKNISIVPNSIIVDEDISMDIEVSIDGSESSIILEEVDNSNLEDLFDGKNLKIESEEIALVVPLPTKSPVLAPTSSIPTIAPSITGLVASIEISKPVTSSLSTEELDLIEQTIVDAFFNGTTPIEGEEAPYNVEIEYTTQGTMKVDVPSGTSEEDVINVLVDSIAETLGVHPSNIEVEYNPTTGEVIYTITSEDAETLSDITSPFLKKIWIHLKMN